MTTLKKILLVSVGLITVGGIYAWQKIQKLKAIFDKIEMAPVDISNLHLDGKLEYVSFNCDVKMTNPTNDDFFVTGSVLADLKQILFYYKGKYIATSDVNMNELSIPAKSFVIIKKIYVQVNFDTAIDLLPEAMNFSMNNITCTAKVQALGSEFLIEN